MNLMIGVKLLKPDKETKNELVEKLNKMVDSLSQEEKRKFFCGNSCVKEFRLDVLHENCIRLNDMYKRHTFNEYCAIEEFLSSVIELRCLDNIFTYTELLKTDDTSFPFYIAEKVHRHVSCTEESSHLSEKDYKTFRKSYDNFSSDIDMYNSFAEKIFECYPNQFEDFLLFVKDFDINDLDFYNAGYDLAGNFRIFDYSGYWG